MTVLKPILPYAAGILFASHALAEAPVEEINAVDPAIIEQLDIPNDSPKSVPEPQTFGAICLGVAIVIYSRRWRRRA